MEKVNKMNNVAVVLHQPKLSENIGAAARAAVNMGLGGLVVVRPNRLDLEVVKAMGTRVAHGLIDDMAVYEDLTEALAGFQFVVGTTARRGSHRGPFFNPGEMAERIRDLGPATRVGLLFGTERSGLTNGDLRHCQAVVRIPTADPTASSLNLAQAVLILGYELLLGRSAPPSPPKIKPAPNGEVEAMYDHLSETLVNIGFLPRENTGHWLMSFKRIFNRSGLTHGECNLIRGMCRQIKWAVEKRGPKEV